jgi:hypothetical protein
MADIENIRNGLLEDCARQALDEFTKSNWRDVSPNALMLVVYLAQKARDKELLRILKRPMWFLISVLAGGVIWMIISDCLGMTGG